MNLPGNKVLAQNHSSHKLFGVLHGILTTREVKGRGSSPDPWHLGPGFPGSSQCQAVLQLPPFLPVFYNKTSGAGSTWHAKSPHPTTTVLSYAIPRHAVSETGLPSPATSSQSWPAQVSLWLSGILVVPASSEAPSCLPQQASWRGVGEALEGRVLGAQEEGEDGSCACSQGVAYHNQAIVFGSTALEDQEMPESPPPVSQLTLGE